MRRLLQLTLLLAGLAWCVPAHAFADQLHPAAQTCTTGTACTQSVTLTAGWGVLAMVGNVNGAVTVSSFAAAGCAVTWTRGPHISSSSGGIEIWYCLNAATGTVSVGPTWSGACLAGPTCWTRIVAASATGTIAVDAGASAGCTGSGTIQNPPSCAMTTTGGNELIGITASYNGTLASTSPATWAFGVTNGNGHGYQLAASYSAPTWNGNAANPYQVAAFALQDTTAAGGAIGFDKSHRYEQVDE